MNKLQKSLLGAGVGIAICAVPIVGAVIGASLAGNALVGGLLGLAIGAAAAPLPVAIAATRQPDGDKSRLRRIAEFTGGMYSAVGVAATGLLGWPFRDLFKKKDSSAPVIPPLQGLPAVDKAPVQRPASVTPAFDAVAQKPDAAPARPAAPEAPKPPAPPAP